MPIQIENFINAIKDKNFSSAQNELAQGHTVTEVIIALRALVADPSVDSKIIVDYLLQKINHNTLVRVLDNAVQGSRAENIVLAILKNTIESSPTGAIRLFVKFSANLAKRCFVMLTEGEREKIIFMVANTSSALLQDFFVNCDAASCRKLMFSTPTRHYTELYQTADGKNILLTNGVEWLQNEAARSELADESLAEKLVEFVHSLTLDEKATYLSRAFRDLEGWEVELKQLEEQDQKENKDEKQAGEAKQDESSLPSTEVKIEIKETKDQEAQPPAVSPHYLWWQQERSRRLADEEKHRVDEEKRRQGQRNRIKELDKNINDLIAFTLTYLFNPIEQEHRLALLLNKKLSRTARGKIFFIQPHKYLTELAQFKYYRIQPDLNEMKMIVNMGRRKIFNGLEEDELASLFLEISSDPNQTRAKIFDFLMTLWFDIGNNQQLKTKILEKFAENGKSALAAKILRSFDAHMQAFLLQLMKPESVGVIFKHMKNNNGWEMGVKLKSLILLLVALAFTECVVFKERDLDFKLISGSGLFFLCSSVLFVCTHIRDKNLWLLSRKMLPLPVREAVFCSMPLDTQGEYLADSDIAEDDACSFYQAAVTKDPTLSVTLLKKVNIKPAHTARTLPLFLTVFGENAATKANGLMAMAIKQEYRLAHFIWTQLKIAHTQAAILKRIDALTTEDSSEAKTAASFVKNLFNTPSFGESNHVALLNAIGKETIEDINLQFRLLLSLEEEHDDPTLSSKKKIAAVFNPPQGSPYLIIEAFLFARLTAKRPDIAAFVIAQTKRFFDKVPHYPALSTILENEYPKVYAALPLACKYKSPIVRQDSTEEVPDEKIDVSTSLVLG